MQQAVDYCQTASDVWAAAARVRAWRVSLKPPIRRIPIRCNDRPVMIPIIRPKPRRMPGLCSAKFVQQTVAAHFGVNVTDLLSRRRDPKSVLPRHIAIYVLKNVSTLSLPDMGRRMGGRDHTTIYHALNKIEAMIARDPEIKKTVETLIRECTP